MTKNPFYNAGLALLYIVLVVLGINFGSHLVPPSAQNSLLAPIAMISLFVLSAAIMAYIVLYQPITMYMDGKRKEALQLFWRTIAAFAVSAAVIMIAAMVIFK